LITLPRFSVSSAISLADLGGRQWHRLAAEVGDLMKLPLVVGQA
jgi:hypothetical protein